MAQATPHFLPPPPPPLPSRAVTPLLCRRRWRGLSGSWSWLGGRSTSSGASMRRWSGSASGAADTQGVAGWRLGLHTQGDGGDRCPSWSQLSTISASVLTSFPPPGPLPFARSLNKARTTAENATAKHVDLVRVAEVMQASLESEAAGYCAELARQEQVGAGGAGWGGWKCGIGVRACISVSPTPSGLPTPPHPPLLLLLRTHTHIRTDHPRPGAREGAVCN